MAISRDVDVLLRINAELENENKKLNEELNKQTASLPAVADENKPSPSTTSEVKPVEIKFATDVSSDILFRKASTHTIMESKRILEMKEVLNKPQPSKEEIENILKISDENSPERIEAHVKAGDIYFEGRGIPKDNEKAREHWVIASQMGHIEVQKKIKSLNQSELNRIHEEHVSFIKWWDELLKADAAQQSEYALRLYKGDGVPKDICKAITLWTLLANNGNIVAQNSLANHYYNLHEENPYNLLWENLYDSLREGYLSTATRYWRMAANQKDAIAQSNLGISYIISLKNQHNGNYDDIHHLQLFREICEWFEASKHLSESQLGLKYLYQQIISFRNKKADLVSYYNFFGKNKKLLLLAEIDNFLLIEYKTLFESVGIVHNPSSSKNYISEELPPLVIFSVLPRESKPSGSHLPSSSSSRKPIPFAF